MKILFLYGALLLMGCASHNGLKSSQSLASSQEQQTLSNLDAPERMYLFYENERGNEQFIIDMSLVVQKYNRSQTKAHQLGISIFAENKPGIDETLKNLVSTHKELAQAQIHLLNAPMSNAWPQDAGQFIWRSGKPLLLDIKQETPWSREFVKYLSKNTAVLSLPFDSKKSSEETSNEGGNIEVLPTGDFYVGDTLTASMIQNLNKIQRGTLVLPAKQLSVGHVDDLFAIIPVDKGTTASKGCDFAILKSDPLDGLRLLLSSSVLGQGEEPTVASFLKALAWAKRDPHLTTLNSNDKKTFNTFLESLPQLHTTVQKLPAFTNKKESVSFEEWYVAKAILLQKDIDKGLQKIKEVIGRKNPKCASVSDISVPVIFGGEQYGELAFSGQPATDADFLNSAVNFSNPFTNMVVLGDMLVVPDYSTYVQTLIVMPQAYSKSEAIFKKTFSERLSHYGIRREKIHYVDATGYLVGMGGVHSGVLIQRRPVGTVRAL